MSSADIGPRLQQTYPEVVKTVRFKAMPVAILRNGTGLVNESDVYQVDKRVFEVFSYNLLSGSKTALNKPYSLVLTQKIATKYFGTADPMGKTLLVNKQPYTVSGVLRDLPVNSDLKFSMLLSWQDAPPLLKTYSIPLVLPTCY